MWFETSHRKSFFTRPQGMSRQYLIIIVLVTIPACTVQRISLTPNTLARFGGTRLALT